MGTRVLGRCDGINEKKELEREVLLLVNYP